jgi:hypothetical protein
VGKTKYLKLDPHLSPNAKKHKIESSYFNTIKSETLRKEYKKTFQDKGIGNKVQEKNKNMEIQRKLNKKDLIK